MGTSGSSILSSRNTSGGVRTRGKVKRVYRETEEKSNVRERAMRWRVTGGETPRNQRAIRRPLPTTGKNGKSPVRDPKGHDPVLSNAKPVQKRVEAYSSIDVQFICMTWD